MSLHGKIFAILEKPLDLTTNLILGLARGNDSASHAGSKDGLYKPSPSTHASITSNPLIPAVLLLLVGFLVLYSSPVQTWLEETGDLPTLAQIFSFSRKQKPNVLPKEGENVSVWAKAQSGFYYCQGGTLFGNEPGTIMAQGDALTSGYRPFGGDYCTGGQQMVADSGNPPSENQQPPEQASISTPQESLDEALMKPSDISKAEAGIKVWAIQQFGSYYCQGQVLFGNDRGKLMSQADALSAGYRPSVDRCKDDNPKEALARKVPTGPQTPAASATASMPQGEPLPLVSKTSEEMPKAEDDVQVWVKKEFGFYYCRNDVLFGKQPGQLMTQASALNAGYQPSDGHCADKKPTGTTAKLRPQGVPGPK